MRREHQWVLGVDYRLALQVEEHATEAGLSLRDYVEHLLGLAVPMVTVRTPAPPGLKKRSGVMPDGGCGDPRCPDCYEPVVDTPGIQRSHCAHCGQPRERQSDDYPELCTRCSRRHALDVVARWRRGGAKVP